jgi:hypothetical protein
MPDPSQFTIDGATYHVGPLPPRRALKLGNRVMRVTGPGLVALIASANGSASLADLDVSALGAVLHTVFAELSPDEQDAIMVELLATVQVVNGDRLVPVLPIFDAHFAARLPAALELMWEALKVNFASFGPALAGLGAKAGAKSNSRGSTTSSLNGQSGAS